jgi:hypothetical protein
LLVHALPKVVFLFCLADLVLLHFLKYNQVADCWLLNEALNKSAYVLLLNDLVELAPQFVLEWFERVDRLIF